MTQATEYVGDVRFKPLNVPEAPRDEWLERASLEFTMSRVAAIILKFSDAEAEDFARKLGNTPEDQCNAMADMAEWFLGWKERYEAGAEVIDCAVARLLIIGQRLCGRETWEAES